MYLFLDKVQNKKRESFTLNTRPELYFSRWFMHNVYYCKKVAMCACTFYYIIFSIRQLDKLQPRSCISRYIILLVGSEAIARINRS